MCFSASASFTTAGILTCIGLLTITQTRNQHKYLMLAAIPLLFAVQQFAEGIVWLTMGKDSYQHLHMISVYVFLIFALIIWPVWIPFSLRLCEFHNTRKKWLTAFSCLGLLVSSYMVFILLYYPVSVQVFNCSIWYSFDVTSLLNREISIGMYALATIGPFFVSSLPYASFFGGALLVSLLFTALWMYTTFISVWCFFAALLSIFTYFILRMQLLKDDFAHTQRRTN